MRIPESLVPLLEQGIIEEVIRPLLSGKEAQLYIVLAGGVQRVAKIYKSASQRSFKNRADYTEGRRVRSSRDQRAMNKGTRYGRNRVESNWRNTESDIMARLESAGVRVPQSYAFVDEVLVMELICDSQGNPAPRLADCRLNRKNARKTFEIIIADIVKMLCAGVVHADLSHFNILMDSQGPVVIDFPQAVDAAQNANAHRLFIRDIDTLTKFFGQYDASIRRLRYGQEMWSLYEKGELKPQTKLTGKYHAPATEDQAFTILDEIAAIEKENRLKRESLGLPPARPARQPVVFEEEDQVSAKEGTSAPQEQGKKRRRRRKRKGPGGAQTSPQGASSGSASTQEAGRSRKEQSFSKGQPKRSPGDSATKSPSSKRSQRPRRGHARNGGGPEVIRIG
jgi:RIO kinase 1